MAESSATLTIGAFAKAGGVGVEAIRYYQRRGLLPEPSRPPGQVRRYGPADVQRVRFLKSAQRLGFNLDEISVLLRLDDGTDCAQAQHLAVHKLDDVRARIAALGRIETALAQLVDSCQAHHGDIACPLIVALSHET